MYVNLITVNLNYLHGLIAVTMNLSPNPLKFQRELPNPDNPAMYASGCMLTEIHVEFLGTIRSLFCASVVLSPSPSNS